jgi:Ca2+/Na+ antiporter
MTDSRNGRGVRVVPARDLAVEARGHAVVRETFLRHAMTRLPLIGVFVITLNLFVQVRGDVGLAVAIAQNLTFGAVAVIVLLNLLIYIVLGAMVAVMPLVFDRDYNIWTRFVGSAVLLLLAVVLFYTASWLLLVGLLVLFLVVGVVVLRGRRKPAPDISRDTVDQVLLTPVAPVDGQLRTLWAQGRAMLRVIGPPGPPMTPAEAALQPPAEPKVLAAVVDEWNARSAEIREPRSKSVTRLAFAAVIGFVVLFGTSVLTQPIRFAPLELVSINGAAPAPGFVLLQGGRGIFVPNPFGAAQFITSDDLTSVQLCEDTTRWWSISAIEALSPGLQSGVDCTPSR